MAQRRSDSPTLPLPPPRSRISFEEFVEAATAAALRAARAEKAAAGDAPLPLGHRPIWIGIIYDPFGAGGGIAAGSTGTAE